ncbi:kinase-like domain-containing protein [Phaeosphaeriaceae sp. PMI808]|nr:kinase-like domain-containing protein [Phaeosphaeriaceae sp. PMI808]
MAAPKLLVVAEDDTDRTAGGSVCGMLYPYYKNGSLADALNASVQQNFRIPLGKKAKWYHQIVCGLHHVHTQGNSWHQDLKPPNILLDDDENIIIIDWEQGIGGTNTFISAPETYRDVDAQYLHGEGSKVIYIPYTGPPRMNNVISTPKWNVFPSWSVQCRKAVELAEVYSLGATMFLICEQVALEQMPGVEDYSTAKMDVVDSCTKEDPNERMGMSEVLDFWNEESSKFGKK